MKTTEAEIVPEYISSKEKRKKKHLRVNTQMLIGFEIFTVIIIVILWVFQIGFLDTFYENIKKDEVRSTAQEIVNNIQSDDLDSIVLGLFVDRQINIHISDELGNPVVYVKTINEMLYGYDQANSTLQDYSRFDLIERFDNTVLAGGSIMTEFTVRRERTLREIRVIDYSVTVHFADESGNQQNRLIFLETEITPVDATVDTLQIQLMWLTGIMIVLGIALAFIIAKRISKPIVAMNTNAKKLAQGNYSVHFDEEGSREVTELAQTMNYAAKELSKVEALRSELIANVSHDLRTPLTMIKGYSEVMRDLPGENSPENLQVVIDETARLADLVNDMLDLSRLESGAAPLDIERFNLTEEIREILKRYDKLADFTFTFDAPEEVYIEADRLKISQVVYNLVSNAVNYIGEDKRIILRQIMLGDKVRIEVIDHGQGIPADKLRDIWDRYYKVDKEHKRAQVGTGLGLSIVKNILDMHGGTYGVSSRENVGSTFWFELKTSEIKGERNE